MRKEKCVSICFYMLDKQSMRKEPKGMLANKRQDITCSRKVRDL